MSKTYLLQLDGNDLGQILDGLRLREESWRKTAQYCKSGKLDDAFVIEECNGEYEASAIALFYTRIIHNLERQRDDQRSVESELYLQGKADGQHKLIQRVLANWQFLKRMGPKVLHARLLELKDEICND